MNSQVKPKGYSMSPEEMVKQEYLNQTQNLLPSLVPNNKVYKQKVGECIFPFVGNLAPKNRVPKITGMLIELPLE